jgi:hypothetical protein
MALSKTDEIESGDLFVLWKTGEGDYRALSTADFITWMEANLNVPGAFVTKYSNPSATGFQVSLEGTADQHLILTPGGAYAAGTINLPPMAGAADGQRVLITCTQVVTILTLGLNGATAILGGPTTLAANAFFTLRYDAVAKSWYRVG